MTSPVMPPRLTLPIDGRPRQLVLREAETQEIVPLVLEPDLRVPDLVREWREREMLALIDTIDGSIPSEAEAAALVRSPEALATVLHLRDAFYDRLVELGRALPVCPHCTDGAVELDLLFYWLALRLPAWRLAGESGLIGQPSLASELPAGRRPAAPPCMHRLDFRYGAGTQGALRSLFSPNTAAREALAFQHHAPPGTEPDDAHPHWRHGSIGFKAILRLSLALTWPDGREATPLEVDGLPVGAFFFLDLLHFATCNVDVVDADRLAVSCPSCGGRFLPVFATTA